MNKKQVVKLVRNHIKDNYVSEAAAAREWGITPVHLNDALRNDERTIPRAVLDAFGLSKEIKKTVVYREIN